MMRSKSKKPSTKASTISLGAASGAVVLSFAIAMGGALAACGGGIGTVAYEARQPPRAPVPRQQVAVYDIDCRDPTVALTDCTFNGGLVAWQVLGVFHTPQKAANANRWGKYRTQVVEIAASRGCPAVAVRRYPPSGPNEPIGAFCVDPALPPVPIFPAGVPGMTPGAAPITYPPRECNSDADCPPSVKCMRGTCRGG